MKKIICTGLILIFFSCGKDTGVRLAKIENTPVTTVNDAAVTSFFYDVHQPDGVRVDNPPEAGLKNRVFRIDERLLLRQIIPQLKNEMEKTTGNDPLKFYFEVIHAEKKRGFLDFSGVHFMASNQFSKFYVKDFPEEHMALLTLGLNFKRHDEITVDGNAVAPSELLAFLENYIDFVSEGKSTRIYLNFDENLTFGEYISKYALVLELITSTTEISRIQFVYNEALLPDCNCVL